MPWSGWPAEWATPAWGHVEALVDTAWMCLDLNVVDHLDHAAVRHDRATAWCRSPVVARQPDPDLYTSWDEFAKQLWWDYQMGEAFVHLHRPLRRRLPGPVPRRASRGSSTVEMGGDGRATTASARLDLSRRPAAHPLQVDDVAAPRHRAPRRRADAHGRRRAAAALRAPCSSGRAASRTTCIKHPAELSPKQAATFKRSGASRA